jgi:hypothetical protein
MATGSDRRISPQSHQDVCHIVCFLVMEILDPRGYISENSRDGFGVGHHDSSRTTKKPIDK